MFHLFSIAKLIEFLTNFTAYALLVTLVGCFRAWVSKKMGDDTAEEQGYLTLSPVMHISALGVLTVMLFGIGVVNMMPLNPHMYHGKWRKLKMLISAYSGVFAYFTLSIVALVTAILLCGNISCISEASPIISSIAGILGVFIKMSLFFAALELVSYSVFLFLLPFAESHGYPLHYIYLGSLLVSLVLLLAFGNEISILVYKGLIAIVGPILHLLGV